MSISPENQEFLNEAVESGMFPSRDHAINEGVAMLRQREQLRVELATTRKQLDEGDCEEFDGEGLRSYFDALKQRAASNIERLNG